MDYSTSPWSPNQKHFPLFQPSLLIFFFLFLRSSQKSFGKCRYSSSPINGHWMLNSVRIRFSVCVRVCARSRFQRIVCRHLRCHLIYSHAVRSLRSTLCTHFKLMNRHSFSLLFHCLFARVWVCVRQFIFLDSFVFRSFNFTSCLFNVTAKCNGRTKLNQNHIKWQRNKTK